MINLDDTKQLERIAEAVERIAEAETHAAGLTEQVVQRTGAEPAGVPILLIVEVLVSLIVLLIHHGPHWDGVTMTKLRGLRDRLGPYLPAQTGEEVE